MNRNVSTIQVSSEIKEEVVDKTFHGIVWSILERIPDYVGDNCAGLDNDIVMFNAR